MAMTEVPWKCRGDAVVIYPLAKILKPENISLGSHIIIDDFVFLGGHEELCIGNYVHIASHASITGGGRCFFGDFSGLSSGVRVLTGTDDFLGGGLLGPTVPPEFRRVTRSAVVLESHAVVGAGAVVLPGVRIGEGAAVGAGSVVTRDLPPWGVYAGVPARFLKPRPKEIMLAAEQELYARHGRPARSWRQPPDWSLSDAALHPPDHSRAA
jgi:galactoside O-acetyltransferase